MDLIADIGATNTRCGLLSDRGEVVKRESFANADFASPAELLSGFLDRRRATDRPKRAGLAIAAPILDDEISMLNLHWKFRQSELQADLGLARLVVVNDFEAVGWSLPLIDASRRLAVGRTVVGPPAAMGVLGPGSGLGVGGLVPGREGWAAISGEGGHVTITPGNETEAEIAGEMTRRYGHCSAETLLSGPGLVRIYLELARLRDRESEIGDPADVTALALRGEPLALEAMNVFFGLLGSVAGNLALTLGARGGIFVAGGIVPRVSELFARSSFRERFLAKGRYRGYLDAIPTYLITDPVPAFLGLRTLLGYA